MKAQAFSILDSLLFELGLDFLQDEPQDSPQLFVTTVLSVHCIKWVDSGCKENHFYSLPLGQAEGSIY